MNRQSAHISRIAQSVRELWSYVDMQIEEYKKKVLQIEPQSCRKETNLATGAISLILNKNEYDKVPVPLKSYVITAIQYVKLRGTRRISVQSHVQAVEKLEPAGGTENRFALCCDGEPHLWRSEV